MRIRSAECFSLRKEAALWSGDTAADTSASLGRWRQGEHTTVWLRWVWALGRHLTFLISLTLCRFVTRDVLGGFPMFPVRILQHSSVSVNKNLASQRS